MHGGTQRHEKSFGAVQGGVMWLTLPTKNPARWGAKGGANQEFSAFALSALGDGYHTIRTEHSSDLKFKTRDEAICCWSGRGQPIKGERSRSPWM
jgi:hypothetical protein